jgi:AcrR family transcriptional regulator
MGINPPSLYKAFGSKEELFFKVIDFYNQNHGNFMSQAFQEETDGLLLIRRLLRAAAKYHPASRFPGGCLVISAALGVGKGKAHVASRLTDMRNANILALAKYDGISLPIARFVGATLQGMSQQAHDGLNSAELRDIAELAILTVEAHLKRA